jgi:hypothetical protein
MLLIVVALSLKNDVIAQGAVSLLKLIALSTLGTRYRF